MQECRDARVGSRAWALLMLVCGVKWPTPSARRLPAPAAGWLGGSARRAKRRRVLAHGHRGLRHQPEQPVECLLVQAGDRQVGVHP